MIEMQDLFERTRALLGDEAMAKLNNSRVAVFGVGGVGGYVVEALARSGVGGIDVFDKDTVAVSNINRQIIATNDTVGMAKVDAIKARVKAINPKCVVHTHEVFYLPENADNYDFSEYDYIVDAIDTVTAKLEIIVRANECGIPVISSMGTGNKLDPTRLEVADISKTEVCPLARVMRRELRARGINHLKVVYSKEEPIKSEITENGKSVPGSVAFVPSVAGLIIAGEVIKDLIKG